MEPIEKPDRWLVATARRKRLEQVRKSRNQRLATEKQLEHLSRDDRATKPKPIVRLTKSRMWNALSKAQAYALSEAVMFDRSVTEVASEIHVNRSTVKSWISRIPRRLATDSYFQSICESRRG